MRGSDKKLTARMYRLGKRDFAYWSLMTRRGLFAYLFAFAALWLVSDREFYITVTTILSILLTFSITLVIRYSIRRPRPNFNGEAYTPWLKAYSFPSAHSAVAFSFATVLSLLSLQEFSHPLVWVGVVLLYLAAAGIAVSRIAVGVHYCSDILAGALIGLAVSVMVLGL